jgi:hypothetical protein
MTWTGLPFMPVVGRLTESSGTAYRDASIRVWETGTVVGDRLSDRKWYELDERRVLSPSLSSA